MEQVSKAERFVLEVCRTAMIEGNHGWKEIRSRIREALSGLPEAEREGLEFELRLMVSREEDQTSGRVSH